MESNFIPETLPTFLDLRIKIIDTYGRLNAMLEEGVEVRGIGGILGHQGLLLLELEENWAGLNLEDLPPASEAYHERQRQLRLAA